MTKNGSTKPKTPANIEELAADDGFYKTYTFEDICRLVAADIESGYGGRVSAAVDDHKIRTINRKHVAITFHAVLSPGARS